MDGHLTRLYPGPPAELPLNGLYLAHDLRREAGEAPFVYTNFVVSLDGRISQPDPETGLRRVPPAIANARDWRLYLELAAQADVFVTTARHLRAIAAGRHGELVDLDAVPDLIAWRRAQGLPPSPSLVAVSQRLDIPIAPLAERLRAPLLVLTGPDAPPDGLARLSAAGVECLRADTALDGHTVVRLLAARGHRLIYSIAGSRVAHMLFAAGQVRRLYLSLATLVLGGEQFDTLALGPPLTPPARFHLHSLHHDAHAPEGADQLLAAFERASA